MLANLSGAYRAGMSLLFRARSDGRYISAMPASTSRGGLPARYGRIARLVPALFTVRGLVGLLLLSFGQPGSATDIPPITYIYGTIITLPHSDVFTSKFTGPHNSFAGDAQTFANWQCAVWGWHATEPGPDDWLQRYNCVDDQGIVRGLGTLWKRGVCPVEVAPVQPQNGYVLQDGVLVGGWTYCTLSPGQPNPGKSAGPPRCEITAGTNPINVGTGNKYEAQLDYMGSGPLPLVFERHYNSDINALGGVLLSNWRHTYDRYIVLHQGMTPPVASANRPDGTTYSFRQSGSVWIADQDVPDKLVQLFDASNTPTGWRYLRAQREETEVYDAKGKLLSISSRAGLTQRLTYHGSSRLTGVTDPFGRSLSLGYDADGRVAQLSEPAGRPFAYTYDANNNVSTVTYPDGKTRT